MSGHAILPAAGTGGPLHHIAASLFLPRVAQMPDDAATDNRREIHLLGEATAVFFIRQDIRGQWQPTPHQHCDHMLLTEGTNQPVEGHE